MNLWGIYVQFSSEPLFLVIQKSVGDVFFLTISTPQNETATEKNGEKIKLKILRPKRSKGGSSQEKKKGVVL